MKADTRFMIIEEKIRSAFLELCVEAGFEAINVKMLVDRAGINRTTFYNHYNDKFHLLDTMEEELFFSILDIFTKGGSNPPAIPPTLEQLELITGFIETEKEKIAILCSDHVDSYFIDRIMEKLMGIASVNVLSHLSDTSSEYMQAVGCGAIAGLYKTWIRRGFQETHHEFLEQIMTVRQVVSIVLAKFPSI